MCIYWYVFLYLFLGREGGKFLSRMKIKKPKEEQNPDPRLHSLHYTLNDLYVGAIVNFNSHHFLITAADEYVFAYMQRDSEKEKVTDDLSVLCYLTHQNRNK